MRENRSTAVRDDDAIAWLLCEDLCSALRKANNKDVFCDVIKAMLENGNEIGDFQEFIDENYSIFICEETYKLSRSMVIIHFSL
jgi:hypothetical protein